MRRVRLQVLVSSDQRERLARVAAERGTSLAALVRDAIDLTYPSDAGRRREAARAILAAEPMDVPDVAGLREELDALRIRRT